MAGINNLIYTYMQAGFCDLGSQLVHQIMIQYVVYISYTQNGVGRRPEM